MSQYFKNCLSLLLVVAFASTNFQLSASIVPVDEAKALSKVAFAFKSAHNFKKASDIKITETYTQYVDDEPAYYIFNMEPKGFVIVSAEDQYNAILAFSDESQLTLDNDEMMVPIFGTLVQHEQHIEYIRNNDFKAVTALYNGDFSAIDTEWNMLRTAKVNQFAGKNDPEGMVVAPLTTTTWNQGEFYNAYTPADADPEAPAGRTYCGCAPIAMSQLIKFHNYPPTGNGSITYEDSNYGTQSADFCRDYNWSNMPDSLSGPNDDVAEFIYHVGASTNTEYSTVYTSTFVSYIRDALVQYWNYDEAADWFFDINGEFSRVAINDLNQGRPTLLTGEAWSNGVFGGAHAWIADGYGYFLNPTAGQPDEYFHFNWGWGGDNNGWFLDANGSWAPIPFSAGIQPITYYWERYVVHNVFPAAANCGAPKSLYISQVTPFRANLNTDYVNPSEYIQTVNFRYREVGTTTWTVLNQVNSYVSGTQSLEPDTEYEYQVRKKCCEGSWSDYTDSAYFTTLPDPNTSPCDNLIAPSLSTSSIAEQTAYVYTTRPYGDQENQFRYRFVGSTLWTYSSISDSYYRFLRNLEAGTDYEFQVRHMCDLGQWTGFSASMTFTTAGIIATCGENLAVNLFTSSTTETKSYVYTSQPYGRVDNQFRYRPVGTSDWATSSTTDGYYRYLTGLNPGTEYEFQVSHNCNGTSWTDWSFSHTFTTLGGTASCDAVNGERLYFNAVTSSNAYIYTPQPYGQVANQFRYRVQGSAVWTMSSISTLYYRYLSNLQAGSTYEYQTSHECAVGTWSDWSTSKVFVTSSKFTGGGGEGLLLPPREDPSFHEGMLDELITKVYPSPASHNITFASNKAFTSDSKLRILDVSGRTVYEANLVEGQKQESINIESLSQGIFLLHYENDNESKVQRFIKE